MKILITSIRNTKLCIALIAILLRIFSRHLRQDAKNHLEEQERERQKIAAWAIYLEQMNWVEELNRYIAGK